MLHIRSALLVLLVMAVMALTLKASVDLRHAIYHKCSQENCPECKKVRTATSTLSTLKSALEGPIFVAFFFDYIESGIKSYQASNLPKITPVTLKVKLLN